MTSLNEHEEDCIRELGEPFTEVHQWLDEIFRCVGPDHRGYRHNRIGVEEVRRRWGDRAAKAAEIHLRRDEQMVGK
jgi:hypothetical protein